MRELSIAGKILTVCNISVAPYFKNTECFPLMSCQKWLFNMPGFFLPNPEALKWKVWEYTKAEEENNLKKDPKLWLHVHVALFSSDLFH